MVDFIIPVQHVYHVCLCNLCQDVKPQIRAHTPKRTDVSFFILLLYLIHGVGCGIKKLFQTIKATANTPGKHCTFITSAEHILNRRNVDIINISALPALSEPSQQLYHTHSTLHIDNCSIFRSVCYICNLYTHKLKRRKKISASIPLSLSVLLVTFLRQQPWSHHHLEFT